MPKANTRIAPGLAVVLLAIFSSTIYAADDASLGARVDELEKQVKDVTEWKRADSQAHLAGYGAVTYVDSKETGTNSSFGQVRFNPIFHYQYRDLVMLESELELEAAGNGETETKLEYLAIDLFLNDYMTLVAGKFLSPLGQFRQNLHPLWINRMPMHPAGFGPEQAAPEAEVGLQLRGGIPLGTTRANYSVYVGNGPELEADAGEIEAIGTEGYTRAADGRKVIGARLGFLPLPQFEFGISGASGQATVTRNAGVDLAGDPQRDYTAAGADLSFHRSGFRVLAEYLRQRIGEAPASVAPEAAKWSAWYAQLSYLILQSPWEAVIRYSDYNSPHAEQDQRQTALGVNYWFAPHVVAKLAYELNRGLAGSTTDADRFLAQVAYGF